MDGNILGAILIIVSVLILLSSGEYMAHKGIMSKINARKFIHISVGNIIIFVPLFTNRYLITAIPALFIFVDFLLSPKSPIKKMRLKSFEAGHALGTVYYAISLTFVVWFGFPTPWLIAATFLPVVYGDGFAAVFGSYAKKGFFTGNGGTTKTILGTSAMVVATFISVTIFIILMGYTSQFALVVAVIAAILGTVIEILSPKGFDNLLIPGILLIVFLLIGEYLII